MRFGSLRILSGPDALVGGHNAGRQVPLLHPIVTLGRNPDQVDIQFYSMRERCTVSRVHCSIIYQVERRLFLLRDDGSSAGTWLIEMGRGKPLTERRVRPHEAVELRSGDRVRLGEVHHGGVLLEFFTTINPASAPDARRLILQASDDVTGTQIRRFNGLWPPGRRRLRLEMLTDAEAPERVTDTSENTDIFLSYSRQERELMQRVSADLRANGFSVWTDEALRPGEESWKRAIEQAIERAGCVVVLLSPGAKQSEWVERELDYAKAYDRRIFPLLAKGNEQNAIPFSLINTQHADIRHSYAVGMSDLVTALNTYLDQEVRGD